MIGYSELMGWFDENGIAYTEENAGHLDKKILRVNQRIAKSNNVTVLFAFDEVGIKTIFVGLANVEDENKRVECWKLLNSLNDDYSYVKFIATDEGEVRAEYDMPLTLRNGDFDAEEFIKLFVSVFAVVEKVYPEFMKLQWT